MIKVVAQFRLLVCLSGISLFLSGCAGGNWLVGKWELDKEKTTATFAEKSGVSKAAEDVPQNDLGKLVGGFLKQVGKGLTDVLLDQFANSRIEFTKSEIRIVKAGEGKAVHYEIIERPDGDTITIKLEDGTITSWHREGEYIKQTLNGDENVWLYFRRAVEK